MAILLAKYKNHEWQEIDKTNPNSDYSEQEQKEYMLNEYKLTFGPSYMFKWVNEDAELVEA
jgi:hypothetical protein